MQPAGHDDWSNTNVDFLIPFFPFNACKRLAAVKVTDAFNVKRDRFAEMRPVRSTNGKP